MPNETTLCPRWSRNEIHAQHASLLTWCPGISAIPDVPEQVELPSEPGHYLDDWGHHWVVKENGKRYTASLPEGINRAQTDDSAKVYAPFTRLVPAGSEREAALKEAAAIAGSGSSAREVHPVNRAERQRIRNAILALVPEAEEEKA